MGPRATMYALPFALVGLSRVGMEASVRLFPLRVAMILGLAVYYVVIAASVLLVRRAVPGAQGAPSLSSGKRPAGWRVLLAVVLPVLPLCVFFLLNLAPVAPAFVAAILAFAAINATFEETFWRGLMAHLSAPNRIRILYPAVLFSFMHWFNMAPFVPLSTRTFVLMVISTFVLAIAWMWFHLRERSLLYPIVSHLAIDAFALLGLVMHVQPRLG